MTQAPNEKPAAPVTTGTTGDKQVRRDSNRTSGDCKRELPQWLRDLIGSPPQHGAGVHQWLHKVARQLHAHRDPETIVDLLTAAVDGCGRHVPQSEILAAVESARGCAWQPTGTARPVTPPAAPKWPAVDAAKRQAVIASVEMTVADLWHSSPTTMGELDAEWYIDQLFQGNPLLCIGKDMRVFETAPREHFRGRLGELALLVPSPMNALVGARKADGKPSAHTLENTGPRHFLITEFDSGSEDAQAALLWHLRAFAPLVAVVHSGSKSLHGWWDCRGIDGAIAGRFFRYAVCLGADPATWTRSQFVRVPMGFRHDKQRRQDVLWFDLEAVRKGFVQ